MNFIEKIIRIIKRDEKEDLKKMRIEVDEKLGIKILPKQNQNWKIDIYVGVSGGELWEKHAHLVASGAIILGPGFIEGDFYYYRDISQQILIRRGEDGVKLAPRPF